MSENLQTIETLDPTPFKHFITTIGALPTSFTDSMSYYELLAWFCDYLQNTVIPAINNNAQAVEELQALYIELHDYVENYFDNLDVQEEIDNKLDEMATSGQLQEIVNSYFSFLDGKIEQQNLAIANIDSSVNEKITAQNLHIAAQDGDIQTLESRMDSFTNLEEGSTTGDAELIDGRTSFDGRTFSNIGDNIRNYQAISYNDITANLEANSGYVNKNGNPQTSGGYSYYELQTNADKFYLIDTVATDIAPQVYMATQLTIPDSSTLTSGNTYNKPIIIKGTGGKILINNLNTNTNFYVGEFSPAVNVNTELYKYFTDITADATKVDGKYRNKNGSETTAAAWAYYSFTPKIGKVYRVLTSPSTNAPVAVQQNGLCYPKDVANIPAHNTPTYYDVFCTSDNTMYINELKADTKNTTVKIYESIQTYNVESATDIKADIGFTNKAFFVGDSLTYGQTYTGSGQSYRNFYNYPYYLKKILNINEITEVANPGATAQSWWNAHNAEINQDNCTYFVWLGTNDTYTDTVATDCAGDDYTQFSDTATGYLGKIIGKIASRTNVKIVMLNNFATVGTKATNNKVISDLATKYSAVLIDTDTDTVSTNGYHTAYNGYYNAVHFNNQGHNYIANLVANQLNIYMTNNKGTMELYKAHE